MSRQGRFTGPTFPQHHILPLNESTSHSNTVPALRSPLQRPGLHREMATDPRPRRREDFRIAVLCALQLEYNAATLAFDEFFDEDGDKFGRARGDPNTYTTGRIGKYNVVMALLPSMGTTTSAAAMASFRSSYTELKLALLVGICGGVPSPPGTEKEILLGDVIVSKTMVQYDFGRQLPHQFKAKDTLDDNLGRPNKDIRSLLAKLETERAFDSLQRRTNEILIQIQQTAAQAGRKRTRYPHPGVAQDRLFSPEYLHRHHDDEDCGCDDSWVCDMAPESSCNELECDIAHLVPRERLETKKQHEREGDTAKAQEPEIFIGRVGSGNTVMKSGAHRDSIAQKHDLIAFEMEAAGAWDEVPCVVVKGVCDYADSHKNKKWQTFAAATAASTMKALLEQYIQTDSPEGPRTEFTTQRNNEILLWISKEPYEQHHTQTNREVLEGTGQWLLEDEVFQKWKHENTSSILWLHGIPGSGKSKLTSIVVEDARQTSQKALVYFYCSRNPAEPGRAEPASIAASLARQLARPQPGGEILEAAIKAYNKVEDKAFASNSLTLVESHDLIHKLLESYKGQTITLVIDALDECNEATRSSLLELLESLLDAPALLKIFVSSRDDQDIVYNLKQGSAKQKELRDKIIFELTSKAHGMFRWASLHLQELCRQATDAAIEERLVKMPRTLEGLYREILEKIENRDALADRLLAKNAFSWLLCAREQLKSEVFLAFVSGTKNGSAPAVSRDQLLEPCNNLVLFDESLDAFRFSHLSVREFLEGRHADAVATANALAAERCLLNLADIPSEVAALAPLLKYACLHWAYHAQSAQPVDPVRLCQILVDFFSGEHDLHSPFYRWHKTVRMLRFDSNDKLRKALKLRDAVSYTPSIILVIYAFDLLGVLSPERLKELGQARPRSLEGVTHEELAIRYGSVRVLKWHFDNAIPFNLTQKVVEAAAASKKNGVQVMALLLDVGGADIRITEDVLTAAASNKVSGDAMMALLLERRGFQIEITERIIRAAVRNDTKAVDITSLLFKQCGSQIRITQDIVIAAIRNKGRGVGMMKLLFEERGDEIEISADVILAAFDYEEKRTFYGSYTSDFEPVLSLLLDERGSHIYVTTDFITAMCHTRACTKRVMEMLLDKSKDELQITEKLIEDVAGIWNPKNKNDIMVLLFDRLKMMDTFSDEHMEMVVNRFDGATVRKFIGIYGGATTTTDSIIKAAIGNKDHAVEVMTLLFSMYGSEIRITDEIIRIAARGKEDLMALLLDKRGDEIRITDDIVDLATKNWHFGSYMKMAILKKRVHEVQVTERAFIVAAAGTNGDPEIDDWLLEFLLDRRKEGVQLTEGVVSAAAGNTTCGVRLMASILDSCGDEIPVTEEVLKAAVRNLGCGTQVMALLLHRRGDSIKITEEVVKVAVKNWWCGNTILEILLDRYGGDIPITDDIVQSAASNRGCGDKTMTLLLERCSDIKLTGDVLKAAIENSWCGDRVMAAILDNRRDIPIQGGRYNTALQAASYEGQDSIVQMLLDNNADVNSQGGKYNTALQAASYRGHARIVQMLLDNNADVNIHGGVYGSPLQAAAANGSVDVSRRDNRESAPPPHTGLLRDETLVLRQLLGYSDAESAPGFRPKSLGNRLQQSPMRDVLFVGLDIDTYQGYEQLVEDQQLHIGVSILDTRILEDMLSDPTTANYQEAITSYQFTVGESAYCQRASRRFIFGLSQPISITELKPRMDALVSQRDYVLVLHGTHSDLKILRHLEIDLPAQSLYVIDTNKAAQSPLELSYRYSLEKLLEALQIPYANLHAAGNDAHYCLRALLMIAVFDAQRHPSGHCEALLHLFRAVAQAPRPLTRGEIWQMEEPQREARREAKIQSKVRRKARRAARTSRRLLERLDREKRRTQGEETDLTAQPGVLDIGDEPEGPG
ncbi:Vegetative incompatibility protein HET-E-1 [Colletotrichum tanaceti]|uniref:Vegetative incompatibility protein HET-E-1 n=1 Tax=Colletotrichum tanaceti TaxID=1306861 RepID=A0A4V6DFZ5_9PEZI|nr:Vegetative incompatibility protein HET-E-1 [Colletotrichum tanaceti]TKW50916.1 Vegetative incompatibility protein HET-E-1 [Colletotrichum tanaceti]